MATTDLVTYDQAKAHLKLVDDTDQADVVLKLQQATALVLHYVGRVDNDWTGATDPNVDLEFALVQAAILELVADFYRFRGDDVDQPHETVLDGGYLRANVRRKLFPLRRPSLA